MTESSGGLTLRVLDRIVSVRCMHERASALLRTNFGEMLAESAPADLECDAHFDQGSNVFRLTTAGREPLYAETDTEFLGVCEEAIVLELQRLRGDLLFVHGAALEFRDEAALFVGASGQGKSTFAWAASNKGFRYLSDELCPIDPKSLEVHPYPRALCLKDSSTITETLPAGVVRTNAARHVPASILPGGVAVSPKRISAIFFLDRSGGFQQHEIRRLRTPEAALQLYANCLNSLAHPNAGLTAATRIVTNCRCYRLATGSPPLTVEAVTSTLIGPHSTGPVRRTD